MAHLLSHNWEWGNSRIVLKRVIQNEGGLEQSKQALKELIEFARVDAEPEVVVCTGNFADTLHRSSSDADCVFMGFELPDPEREEEWFDNYEKLLQGLPTTLLVHSTDSRDYLAHD
ncbi:MAG: hypothetical protein ACD_39C01979G0001 [uncultured bacterium]|nr:MAG: hypothetical protein ACD_39C01979G0001 [uncultured bacterium]